MNLNTLSALIGLAGAVGNNGRTDLTDEIVRKALSDPDADLSALIQAEKYRISPDCKACLNPCGNTSDYPMDSFASWPQWQRVLKEQVLASLIRIAGKTPASTALPEVVYKAISYVGYDLAEASYMTLLEELKQW